MSTTSLGDNSIWVLVDQITKMCQKFPTKTMGIPQDLAWLFRGNVYGLNLLPASFVSNFYFKFIFYKVFPSFEGVMAKK